MVEFALVAPVFLLAVFLLMDFGRLLYAFSGISSASREGARILSLKSDQFTDCYAFSQMELVGQGFPLVADPNSVAPDSDPNAPPGAGSPISGPPPGRPSATVPPGVGYIYIYPAVATAAPPDASANCSSNLARALSPSTRQVAVEIQYHFTPLTPIVNVIVPNITLKSISVTQTEY